MIHHIVRLFLLSFLAISVFMSPHFVRAQENADVPTADQQTSDSTSEEESKLQEKLNNLYVRPTYKNILDMYWRSSKLDVKKTRDLDLYLMVSECDITKKYRQNDFEWADIRNATAQHILKNKMSFSNRFRVVQPIEFGEYDFKRGGFAIQPDFQYKGLKSFRISNNIPDDRQCNVRMMLGENPTEFAPYNIGVQLELPFSLTYVPMNKDLSKLYLDYIATLSKKNGAPSDRIAYITFYLTLNGFTGFSTDGTAQTREIALYTGTVDYITISADQNGKYPLYTKDMKPEGRPSIN